MNKPARIRFLCIWLWMLLPYLLTQDLRQEINLLWYCRTLETASTIEACRCDFSNQQISANSVVVRQAYRAYGETSLTINCLSRNLTSVALKQIINLCEFRKNSSSQTTVEIQQCPIFDEPFINLFQAFSIATFALIITNSSSDASSGFRPHHFKNLASIQKLYVTNAGFSELTSSIFAEMTNIRRLKLSNNSITSLPNEIFKPTSQLDFLSIEGNNLTSLHSEFQFPPHLRSLTIIGNTFQNISKNIFTNLTKLQVLHLNDNHITQLDDSIFDNLRELYTLDISKNNLTRLPNNLFSYNRHLSYISLNKACSKEVSTLPPRLFANLTSLLHAEFNDNYFVALPKDLFENCPKLGTIEFNNNRLKKLPDSIFRDTVQLENLHLSSNELEPLNYTIFNNLKKLVQLRLTNAFSRETSTLPPALFANTISLTELYLNDNHFTHIPESLFLNCPNLKVISLANNSLRKLTTTIFRNMKHLKELDLSDNQLESLDTVFTFLENLEKLNLARNRLVSIHRLIFHYMESLLKLDVSSNRLTNFETDTFTYLNNIIDIDLSHNQLTLSASKKDEEAYGYDNSPFCNCKKLETLVLRNNSIDHMFIDWKDHKKLLKLKSLDLSMNKCSVLNPESFVYTVPYLDSFTVNLSDNQINAIPLSMLENMIKTDDVIPYLQSCHGKPEIGNLETTIDLKNNPVVCDCRALQLVNHIQQRKYCATNIIFQDIRCHGPEQFKNASLEGIDLLDLKCTLSLMYPQQSKNCPESCNCEYRSVDHCVIVNCTGAGLRSFPLKLLNLYEFALELEFSRNNFTSLDGLSNLTSIANVTKLVLSFNELNNIDDLDIWNGLKVLGLDNNRISHLSYNTIHQLNASNTLTNLTLHNNPWQCDCQHQYFVDFLQSPLKSKTISNYDNIICEDNNQTILSRRNLCDELTNELFFYVLVTICVLTATALILSTIYYNYKNEIEVWLFAHRICLCLINQYQIDKKKRYDAFVSFSGLDHEFVEEHLMPHLEPEYKLCVHHRDFVIGRLISNQIAEAVENSRRIIIVLTRHFLQSTWTQQEFRQAHTKAIQERCDRTIIILLQDIPMKHLDPLFQAYITLKTYLKWGDPLFWEKLRFALRHSRNNQANQNEFLITNPSTSPNC